jgi:hypothetical protein
VIYVVEGYFGLGAKGNLNQDSTPTEEVVAARPLTASLFFVGLLVILVCAYSQYVIPGLNFVSAVLLVYGIPVLVTGLIWGRTIIKRALNQTLNAVKFGLGYFGAFTILGLLVGIFIVSLLSVFSPGAVNLFAKPNPVLQVSREVAWLMVGVSFLVSGPAEEYLFRGFVWWSLKCFREAPLVECSVRLVYFLRGGTSVLCRSVRRGFYGSIR